MSRRTTSEKLEVAVLGAGVIGLSSALAILEELCDLVNITVIADKFDVDTLSDGAAGIVRPCYFPGDVNGKWSIDTWHRFVKLSVSRDSATAGVYLLPLYQFTNDPNKFNDTMAPFKEVTFGFRRLSQKELAQFPGEWKYGSFTVGCIAEGRRYLPYLMDQLKEYNTKCERRHVYSLEDLSGQYDIVINCSGFAARTLCSDHKLVPVRGQIMRVKAPWVKYAVMGDYDGDWGGYVIPGQDNVVCGGVRQYNRWKLEADKGDRADIWRKVTSLVPSLKDAVVEREWVGLRPYRDPIRLEHEAVKEKRGGRPTGGLLHVIHNYGHGGGGVCLSWGCALRVVEILKPLVTHMKPRAATAAATVPKPRL